MFTVQKERVHFIYGGCQLWILYNPYLNKIRNWIYIKNNAKSNWIGHLESKQELSDDWAPMRPLILEQVPFNYFQSRQSLKILF